ncbi:flp operon protein Flp1 [Actinobacillus pleuropneumoniae]|uniref:Flp operon protein Flp1 n=1 Tax=Actinobacillus pleuropneumoniae serovar 4 str. M62 TaxID=754255 RepID=E0EJ84_ACTPL|nr:Flp family type IVb pilin [Actinobacillus pleuropneumoniae]ADY88099.1 flp operon protein Flp1 [Actinobacillus pleuropneumoniae serovar 4 str. M62]EFM90256.1 Flp operon protein Flp1 [Actinobacillus pleuropneumoniae serovar 4 str. M62]UKH40741.1 Flp family type IVb pilin [Actinobacillus pleuropneumoniae serovar 4 str. M62]SQF64256.1 flp operon protein Flp1 [Actinobacillus pleuropneumoniae]
MLSNLTTKAYISVTEGIRRFKENQQGVTAIEYGLIAVAVAVLIVAVFYNDGGFIQQLQKKFETLTQTINSTNGKL